jgi:hypothetical protein
MKKSIFISGLLLATLLLVTSCKEDIIMFDSSMNLVGFTSSSLNINEGGTGTVKLYLGAPAGTANVTISLVTSVEGVTVPAVEGTDYTLSATSVDVPVGTAEVTITSINNEVFTGNKKFYLVIDSNSADYKTAAQSSVTVTLIDDEHPLKAWIGSYTVTAVSYGNPGAWDETWTVTTAAAAGDATNTKLSMLGISEGTVAAYATFNTTDMTLSMTSPQDLGVIYGGYYGALYYGTDALIAIGGGYTNAATLAASAGTPITGTFDADGTIHIDRIAPILTSYVYVWDVFNTTWTKD